MGRPRQLRAGEHDVPIQDDSFEEIRQLLATLKTMTEKHQACLSEQKVQNTEQQQNQSGASPALLIPKDQIPVLLKQFRELIPPVFW